MSDKKCPNCGYELDSWNDCVSINNILECPECEEHFELKAVTLNEPQLTIPKSIADTLDIAIKGLTEFEDYLWAVDEFDVLVPYERAEYFRKWSKEEMNAHALAVSYVTGKALGVDLVKVVEG